MPTNYRSDLSEEKPAPSVHCSPDSNDGCSPSWMTARVVTRWLCLDPEPAYQPVPSTTAYAYGGTTPMVDSGTSLVVSPSVPSTQPSSFGCDGGLMTQNAYLPNWTPMQPTRVTEVQPSMCKEEMLYPEAPPPTLEGTQAPPGFQPHGYYLPSPTVKLENAPESALHDDPPFIRQGDFGCLPVSLNPPQYFDGYDVEEESDDQISGPAASASLSTYTRPVAAKRGPFKDNEQRAKTALTRKMGSCIRCRMQRIRCVLDVNNANGPCVACRKLFENRANIYRPSCARLKITDMKIFKPGQVRGFEWTRRWKDSVVDEIDTWESVEVRMIEVTEGYTGKTIMLAVRKFRAQEGDKLHRTWVSTNGETKKVEVPPYAIVDMEAAAASIRQYIRSGLEPSFKTLLGSENELIYKTYALALARATEPSPFVTLAEKKLLLNTLDLWFSIRLSTKSFEIVGADLLDMPRNIINDQSSDLHGKVPIPPVLGAQLDSILLHQILARYRRFVLDDLSKMVHEKKPSTWLTTYLATFILLHNAALITRHDAAYARKHGMNRRFARPEEVKEYNIAAQTVLHYYHYCNKGIYPFTAECRDFELQTLAELDGNGIGLVHFTRRCATKQRRHWENLWAEDEYEDEYYYLSQLYEAGWKARSMA
ncbi:hypothetical protein QBC43DRAFT_344699 [Cladorrhinum sp. PSN259]|nr:hypothetical protein QBC43DRAFT_344699 [Cladorrhinum sp. PSN259]